MLESTVGELAAIWWNFIFLEFWRNLIFMPTSCQDRLGVVMPHLRHPAWHHHCFCECTSCSWLHSNFCLRPYCVECTRSHPNSEVKRRKARSVLGWGTAWEALRVPQAFFTSIRRSKNTTCGEGFVPGVANSRPGSLTLGV